MVTTSEEINLRSNASILTMLHYAVLVMLIALPILVAIVRSSGGAIFIVLSAISLVTFWWNRVELDFSEKIWILSLLAFVGFSALSFINADDVRKSISRMERVGYFLFAFPMFLLFRKHITIFNAVIVGFFVSGFVLFYEAYKTGRPEGAYNTILFGDYAASVGVVLFSVALFSSYHYIIRLLVLGVGALASFAALASGTRGAWLALPIPFVLFFLSLFIPQRGYIKNKLFGLVLLALIGVGASISIDERHISRWNSAVSEFAQAKNQTIGAGSVGERLSMVKDSFEIWLEHPLIGTGIGDLLHDNQKRIAAGKSHAHKAWGEGHNLYMEFLATTGVLGLLALLFSLFLLPICFFLQALDDYGVDQKRTAAIIGVCFVLAFMVFGLSQNWLSRSSISAYYVTFLSYFLSMTRSRFVLKKHG
jgi:O-antigen ligase